MNGYEVHFSKALIIHKPITKEILTITEVTISVCQKYIVAGHFLMFDNILLALLTVSTRSLRKADITVVILLLSIKLLAFIRDRQTLFCRSVV